MRLVRDVAKLLGLLVVAGCAPSTLDDADGYVTSVRRDIASASSYSDDDLVEAGESICADGGSTETGARLLADRYEDIAARDRERLAYLAITVGCPP